MHVELGLAFGRRGLKDQWVMGASWWGLELRQGNDAWIGKRLVRQIHGERMGKR